MKRIELAEYTVAGDNEAFLVKVYNGGQGDIVETIEARLIAFTNDARSIAENQAATLRHAAARLVELANQIHPASAGTDRHDYSTAIYQTQPGMLEVFFLARNETFKPLWILN